MLRVLYDHQIYDSQLQGGISRYFCELLTRLHGRDDVQATLGALFSNNVYLRGARYPAPRAFFPGVRVLCKGGHLRAVNRWHCRRLLRRGEADLFHPTYYDPSFLDDLGGRPFVVTVHDMVHELFPGLFAPDDPTRAWKAALVARASGIIAISESTRRDLVRLLGVPGEKVRVIHHAAPALPPPALAPLPGLPARYVLFVGQRRGYKNFLPFLAAVAPLLREGPGLGLVCAGWKPFDAAERAAIAGERLEGRVVQVDAPDDHALATLYRHALAFAYPSRYEGFGLPVLEAFTCGTPAMVSDTPALVEVAGGAAVTFDPGDAGSVRAAVARVVGDEGLRRDLMARGAARLRDFSWARTAEETLAYYRALV